MTIGCGCSHPCHSERKRGNPADRRTHQADNLAKLWQEFLSMLKLIAKIFCAVEIARTSAVNGNRHCVFRFFLGDSHVALLLGMTAFGRLS